MTGLATAVLPGPTLDSRIVRYADLVPCRDAFIDTRTPGSDQKENFTIIGPGVSENPRQHVHIREPHGFNIGGARQPPGCHNSQHSHDTAEVFYVHSGTWLLKTGERGEDGQALMGPGDLISIPTKAFRGFENVGPGNGFLFAVLGGDDPGRVLWAPYVFDMARDYGLVLLEDGQLVDASRGETVPAGKRPMPPTTAAQVAALDRITTAGLERCILRHDQALHPGPFAGQPGVVERSLIGTGPLDWPHGFTVTELRLEPFAAIPAHRLPVPDVWFIQSGGLVLAIDGEEAICGPGDTITVPTQALRSFGAGPEGACVVLVRGGDSPVQPDWA